MKTYKIVEIEHKNIKNDYTYAEGVMNSAAEEGWEVAAVSIDAAKDIRGSVMVITFCRESGKS